MEEEVEEGEEEEDRDSTGDGGTERETRPNAALSPLQRHSLGLSLAAVRNSHIIVSVIVGSKVTKTVSGITEPVTTDCAN